MNDTNDFSIRVQVDNPKPNAPVYEIKTIQELFDILTDENLGRFLKDLEAGMRVSIGVREAMKEIAKSHDMPEEEIDGFLKMPAFTWIDDRQE